jgi:hypothetical protein
LWKGNIHRIISGLERQRAPDVCGDGHGLLQAELVHIRAHIVDYQRNSAAGGERKLEAVERDALVGDQSGYA